MKMNGPIGFFAAHPTGANLLMLIFVVLGLLFAPRLLRETFPDFASSRVEIVAVYPGASAEDVENAVCQRIEDALDSILYVEEVVSTASEGRGVVVVEMTEKGNITQFLADIRSEIEAIDDFPDEVEKPIIRELNRTNSVVSIAVTGPMSLPHLKMYCEQLKDDLLRIPLISQVDIQGFSEHQIRIELKSEALMRYGVSVSDIINVIGRQNVDLPAGTVKTSDADILIRFAEERRKPREFEDLVVVSSSTGAEIRLGDIASITDRFELDEDKIFYNGKRAGVLTISKTKDKDALNVLEQVRSFVKRESAAAPPGVELALTQNTTKIVRDRLDMLLMNGIQGLVLVFAVMWLFFDIRLSFWVCMGLPVSFLGAFWTMYLTGMTINMVTMVGLLLALGLIMDDAIVISENVASHLARGATALQAAVRGTAEVGLGVFSSFLTTVFIFGTLAILVSGNIGKVLWVLPIVLIMTLVVSLVEAFFILPNHLAHSLQKMKPKSAFRVRFDAFFDRIREEYYGRAVDVAIRWRYVTVASVVGLLVLSVGMLGSGILKREAFPDVEGDIVEVRVLLPQGTPLARTEAVAEHLLGALGKASAELDPLQPEGLKLIESVTLQYNKNVDAGEVGPHVLTVVADVLNAETRLTSMDELTGRWRKYAGNIPDVLSMNFKEPVIGPGGLPIDIRLTGRDLEQLKAASTELQAWLARYQGVRDLSDDLRRGKPEILVTLKPGAKSLGFDSLAIAGQLRAAFFGKTAAEVQDGSEKYEIDVRLDLRDRNSMGDLEYFHLTSAKGIQVPLSDVAILEEGRGYARIKRIDSVRTVTIQGDVDTRIANANEIVADTVARKLPELTKKYGGVEFGLEGQAKEGEKTGKSMLTALLLGVFGIFVLLSFQFRSYIEPFAVILAIPLAFIGVVVGHLVLGFNLSMVSLMGYVSLAGVVVNDSILLVEFIKKGLQEGKSAYEAATEAGRNRFRAVFLTSLTTIVGLIPLLSEGSLQAQVLKPLAVSLVCGLLSSTMLVLFVVPSVYVILDDFGLATRPSKEIE